MIAEIGGLVAFTGDDLAATCAEAMALPRQPAFDECLGRFIRNERNFGSVAVIFGLAGTGKKTLLRQLAGSQPDSALICTVSPEADMSSVRAMEKCLRKKNIENFYYENATDLPDFVRGSKYYADLHSGHVVLSGDGTYSFFLASLDRLLCSIYWFGTEPVLHGVQNMDAWLESAVVGNIRQGARRRLFTDCAFGVGLAARLEEQGLLAEAVRAELFGKDIGLHPEDAWAVRNTLLAAGVYESSGCWRVEDFRNDFIDSIRPVSGRPRCVLPELQAYVEEHQTPAGEGEEA